MIHIFPILLIKITMLILMVMLKYAVKNFDLNYAA